MNEIELNDITDTNNNNDNNNNSNNSANDNNNDNDSDSHEYDYENEDIVYDHPETTTVEIKDEIKDGTNVTTATATATATPTPTPAADNNEKQTYFAMVKQYFKEYFKKWKGTEKSPKRAPLEEIGMSWITSFIGILVLALLHYRAGIENGQLILIGSFAASAVLIFGAPKSPLAQPRNLVLGHFISSIVGTLVRVSLVYTNASIEVACALSVSLAITCMHFTKSLHPPGGATALIAVMSTELRWRGFYYIFIPVTSGALIMLLTALIVNNFGRKRKYPVFWW